MKLLVVFMLLIGVTTSMYQDDEGCYKQCLLEYRDHDLCGKYCRAQRPTYKGEKPVCEPRGRCRPYWNGFKYRCVCAYYPGDTHG